MRWRSRGKGEPRAIFGAGTSCAIGQGPRRSGISTETCSESRLEIEGSIERLLKPCRGETPKKSCETDSTSIGPTMGRDLIRYFGSLARRPVQHPFLLHNF